MVALVALAALQLSTPLADLPFTHEPGRIWLRGRLNGQPVRTMLDSGAGGIVVSEEAAAAAGGRKGEASRSNTEGGLSDAWQASGLSFGLEGAPFTTAATAIVSFGRTAGGERIDVAAGMPLFAAFGVGVDYVKRRVRFDWPGTLVPPAGAVALPLRLVDGAPCVTMRLRLPGSRERKVAALVDTGSPLGLEVTRRLARHEGLDDRYRDVPTVDAPGGVGGPIRVREIGRIEGDFGGMRIDGTAVVMMSHEGGTGDTSNYDVLVGDEVLRHFDLAFDYLRQTLWVRPNGK